MAILELEPYPIATQTYPRKQDWLAMNALAGLSASLYKFAFDLRILQSPPFGEWREPVGTKQVSSSAMPFKQNPSNAENIDSLARFVSALPHLAWQNAGHALFERTLDDAAVRNEMLPSAFLAVDEILERSTRIMSGLVIDEVAVQQNLEKYNAFAATERVLMAAAHAGGDRQVLHEIMREHSVRAWVEVRAGRPNPILEFLKNDAYVTNLVPAEVLPSLFDASFYVGDAPSRAVDIANLIETQVHDTENAA